VPAATSGRETGRVRRDGAGVNPLGSPGMGAPGPIAPLGSNAERARAAVVGQVRRLRTRLGWPAGDTARHAAAPDRRTRRRAIVLGVVAGVATALLLLGLDGFLAVRRLDAGITSARADLVAGTESIAGGDAAAARVQFVAAADHASSASGATGRPAMEIARALPFLGDNVRAAAAVAESQEQAAAAGIAMVEAARALAWEDLRAPGIVSLGSLDPTRLRAALPHLNEVASSLEKARAALDGVGGRLIGTVRTGVEDARGLLDRRIALVDALRALGRLLPHLYGDTSARRYLLAVPSLGRPTSGGGAIELVGTLQGSGGTLTVKDVRAAPPAIASIPADPNLRVASRPLLRAATGAGLGDYDGVWFIDARALSDLLWAVGDVETPAWDTPITFENVVRVLEIETLGSSDEAAAATLRATIVRDLLSAVLERRPSLESLAFALSRAVAGRDLAIAISEGLDRRLLRRLGSDGLFRTGSDPLGVLWDAVSANHVGALIRTRVSHLVTLESDGTARVRTVVTVSNPAPTDPPSILLGRPRGADPDPIGSWRASGQMILPRGVKDAEVETSSPGETSIVTDGAFDAAQASFAVDSGDSMSAIVTYTRVGAVTDVEGGREFRLHAIATPSVFPARVVIVVRLPPGDELKSASVGFDVEGSIARFIGSLDRSVELWVRY
jgi:hypothetical protein